MKNYFKSKITPYEEVCDGVKKIGFLYHSNYLAEEKEHVIEYLCGLDDDEKKEYLCNNVSKFNRKINALGYSNDIIKNMFLYIGLIGLVENGFSLLQGLSIDELVLLSNCVYNFITHPELKDNLQLPLLSEKKILSLIIKKEPNNLNRQATLLESVNESFTNNEKDSAMDYISKLSTDEITELKEDFCYESSKGISF